MLGDSGTGTGSFTIDGTSTLYAGNGVNGAIAPFGAGQLTSVIGNYTGNGGAIRLQTVLVDDSSASDRFIISGGTATGTTGLAITNLGGGGAATRQDGILVVQAVNDATTSGSAFGLTHGVAAGAYEYALFRGGVSAGSEENWYLRSAIIPGSVPAAPATDPDPDVEPARQSIQPPGPGVAPPNPGATPVVAAPGEVILLYRTEVATYSVGPPVARESVLATLGTFHERRGEQSVVANSSSFSAAWGRVFG